jgi:hypothetical protein
VLRRTAIDAFAPPLNFSLSERHPHPTSPNTRAAMAGARKRSHATASEEAAEEKDHADCPFSTRYVDKEAEKKKKLKRRKTDGENGEDAGPKIMQQLSPFAPSGKFKTHETMDIHYTVEPNNQWTEMTRYNSFVRKLWSAPE